MAISFTDVDIGVEALWSCGRVSFGDRRCLYGPAGIVLPMEPLTVLIGPNGSGRSSLLEAISLLQAAPRGISEPISRTGGVREWQRKADTPGSCQDNRTCVPVEIVEGA